MKHITDAVASIFLRSGKRLPVQLIRLESGELVWLPDSTAAARLDPQLILERAKIDPL